MKVKDTMKYAVNEEGVAALKQLAQQLPEAAEKISVAAASLQESCDENRDGLGPHADSIEDILEEIKQAEEDATEPLEDLTEKLEDIADSYQDIIDEDLYDSSGEADSSGSSSTSFEKESFSTNIGGIRRTLDIGSGASSVKQLSGAHKDVRKNDGKGYESHHIPSAAVLKMFGINTDEWPTIALLEEDHKQTDSYAGKQRKRYESIFPDAPPSGTYKEECVEMVDTPGGLEQLIYDEILNIKKECGDKYDGAIAQYLDEVEKYVQKHGVPKRKR